MRVFVVGTGRCGTTTFYQACRHITNYTVGHESEGFRIPKYEFDDKHIEVSHLNSIALPLLVKKYPDSMFIHLIRDRQATIQSWVNGHPDLHEELNCWSRLWYMERNLDAAQIAAARYDRVFELCERMTTWSFKLDRATMWWGVFWRYIKAEGSYDEALKEFSRAYNPGVNRGKDNYIQLQED
jgi:hypothetical protein